MFAVSLHQMTTSATTVITNIMFNLPKSPVLFSLLNLFLTCFCVCSCSCCWVWTMSIRLTVSLTQKLHNQHHTELNADLQQLHKYLSLWTDSERKLQLVMYSSINSFIAVSFSSKFVWSCSLTQNGLSHFLIIWICMKVNYLMISVYRHVSYP